jgi:hypothetical protein
MLNATSQSNALTTLCFRATKINTEHGGKGRKAGKVFFLCGAPASDIQGLRKRDKKSFS